MKTYNYGAFLGVTSLFAHPNTMCTPVPIILYGSIMFQS